MSEEDPTLEDAEHVIDLTKRARGTCRDECDIVQVDLTYNVINGEPPRAVATGDGKLLSDLRAVMRGHFGDDWIEAPNHSGFLRRCAKCAAEPLFPWADKLSADKVLAYMTPRSRAGCTFYLGELEQTL